MDLIITFRQILVITSDRIPGILIVIILTVNGNKLQRSIFIPLNNDLFGMNKMRYGYRQNNT